MDIINLPSKTEPYKTGMLWIIMGSVFAVPTFWIIAEFFSGFHTNLPLAVWCIGALILAVWMIGKGTNYYWYYGRHEAGTVTKTKYK